MLPAHGWVCVCVGWEGVLGRAEMGFQATGGLSPYGSIDHDEDYVLYINK